MEPRWWLPAIALPIAAALALRIAHRGGRDRAALIVAVGAAALTLVPGARDHGIVSVLLVTSAALVGIAAIAARRLGRSSRAEARRRWRAVRRARAAVMRAPAWQFGLGLSGVALVLCTALSWLLFRWIPVIQDSQAQLFHAEIFASGRLVADAPPPELAEFFEADHVIVRGATYSQYPPGHTALLALGVLAGAPFLVNPALGALALVLIWRAGRAIWCDRVGRRAALLGLASPFVVFMSSEHMSHATSLACFALQILATARALEARDARRAIAWALVAGAAVGWHALVRPITAAAIAAPLGALTVWRAARAPARLAPAAIAMALAAAAVGSILLWFNVRTNGAPFRMGYVVRWGPEHTLGFGIAPWGSVHTPAGGLESTLSNLDAWNLHLFGGPLPAMLLVALGVARDRRRALVWALAASPLCVLAVYSAYFFQDLTFGPRYVYEASAFALLAASRGIGWLPELLPRLGLASRRAVRGGLVGVLMAWSAAIASLTFLPWIVHEYALGYSLHGGVVDRAEARIPEGRALVFVDGAYQRAFYAMHPDLLGAQIVYARDLGDARNRDLVCALPDREAWVDRRFALARVPPSECPGAR